MLSLFSEETPQIRKLVFRLMLFSLVMHIIASWFTVGYHLYDEHFSIFEFAGYKLGITPADALPWEFPAKLRQALQPGIVYGIMKMMGGPSADPFICSFIVRLIAALIGWTSLLLLLSIGLKWMKNEPSQRFLVFATALLWFFPYLHARFSSESVSGSLFFIGLALTSIGKDRAKNLWLAAGGFITGLAFVSRYQTGFMIFGLLVWLIFFSGLTFKQLAIWAFPAVIAIGIGVLIDHWFYGEWVSTEWVYYKINILQDKASEYGRFPWWSYFKWVSLDLLPPFSFVIIAALLYTFYRFPKNILSLSFIPFVLVHIIIPHKEPRFLFPLISGLPVLMALAYDDLCSASGKWAKTKEILLKIFWSVNIGFLIFSSFKPASDQFGLYEYIYHHYNGKTATLLSKGRQPYHLVDFRLYFHRPQDIRLIDSVSDVKDDSLISVSKAPVLMLFEKYSDAESFQKSHPGARIVYENIPKWLYIFNINNWISRTRMYILFEVK
jgi:GPI mannosyltransferase 3